jgi:O-antigen ligase
VGLGNAGYFFVEHLPTYGWRAPEVVEALRFDNTNFPNIKSLWIRLLAETGIVGFSLFVIWILTILIMSMRLMQARDRLEKALGFAGILGIGALLVEGFSIDTFGLPYYWILFGLVTAASRLSEHENSTLDVGKA